MELIGLGKCALPEGARMPKHPHYQDALRPKRKPIQCLLYKAQGVTSDGCARKDPHVEGICQLCGHAADLSFANVSQKPNRIPKKPWLLPIFVRRSICPQIQAGLRMCLRHRESCAEARRRISGLLR
jgi:hypothetical protein